MGKASNKSKKTEGTITWISEVFHIKLLPEIRKETNTAKFDTTAEIKVTMNNAIRGFCQDLLLKKRLNPAASKHSNTDAYHGIADAKLRIKPEKIAPYHTFLPCFCRPQQMSHNRIKSAAPPIS